MRTLSAREQRTIRIASVAVSIYLALFFGFKIWHVLDAQRKAYRQLVAQAHALRDQLLPYETKAQVVTKLMGDCHIDPAKLRKATIVGEASGAIQKAAASSGVGVGPIRESSARTANKELATVQLEASGPLPAMLALFHRLETVGYPLIIDEVQLTPMNGAPGMIKANLTIVILDFDQWKSEEAPHA
jgi:hypothetical protein